MATAKHYIANEQEHFRQYPEAAGFGFNITDDLSSNIDDRTMHELYLWYCLPPRVMEPSLIGTGRLQMVFELELPPSCARTIRSTTATAVRTATL